VFLSCTAIFVAIFDNLYSLHAGEVNAADAFDIGSFDEEDTKGIKVTTFI
jgi:hypothetical protein